jgi:flagellar motor switch protein FliG
MGVYTRFKKNPDGFRQLVELWETTPVIRRQKMIEIGMEEDAEYTQKLLQYVIQFEDILNLPRQELASVLSEISGRFIAYAIRTASQEFKDRVLEAAGPAISIEIKEFLDTPNVTSVQIGSAQLKMVELTRKLERRGIVTLKKIPVD